MDHGKSCCDCCPPDCQEHINVRSQERYYVRVQGLDGKETFVYMGSDYDKALQFNRELSALFARYGMMTQQGYSIPSSCVGELEKYQTSKYESVWKTVESGQAPSVGYDPFDY